MSRQRCDNTDVADPIDIAVVVPCRMDSRRLPGKVLAEVGGQPLLRAILERCAGVRGWGGAVVVATTGRRCDVPIVRCAADAGVAVYRGALDDVAGRLLGAARMLGAGWVARVNGDSPFVDADLLARACRLATAGGCDLITNLAPRSFPYGVSVEFVRVAVLDAFYQQSADAGRREHPTTMLYESLDTLRYHNITHDGPDLSAVRLTVDTLDDLERLRSAAGILGPSWAHASFYDIVKLYEERVGR